jgi:folate-binding Fe-S cluster repair protein YgfZ
VRRRLVRVEGSGSVPTAPSDVTRGDERVGRLTSVLATNAGWTGLAVVAFKLLAAEGLAVGGAFLSGLEPLPLKRPIGREWAAAG